MDDVWPTLIGVLGALAGSVIGGWMTARAARQTQESANRHYFERERREAFCEATNALLSYRALELKRVHDAAERGASVDEPALAMPARHARTTCRYHLMVMKVLLARTGLDAKYEALLEEVQQISKQTSAADAAELAQDVRVRIESLADDYAQRLAAA